MDKEKVLITTAIDYVNDVIHLGHAYQKMLADCVVRYERLKRGKDKALYVTGTDEHGQKVYKIAQEKGEEIKEYVDKIAKRDQEQQDALNISYDRFIRTTDEDHIKFASQFTQKVYDNGYIYKDTYKGLYCSGCEAYKTEKDLEDGKCPLHPNLEIEEMEEENYFFKLSEFKGFLKEHFDKHPNFVLPPQRFKEMYMFLDDLQDIPITRRKEILPWGIEAPFDKDHVLWVWFDALVNYLTFGHQNNFWDENTKIIHFLGKDNARMHAVLWPAMLEAAGEYVLPTTIYVNAFLSIDGKKISKSLGNIIRPADLVEKYGTDPVRYYFLRYGPIVEDTDYNQSHFEQVYTADLANGLGNTAARLTKLAQKSGFEFPIENIKDSVWEEDWAKPFEECRVDIAAQNIWSRLADLDKHINDNEPWAVEDKDKLKNILTYEINELRIINEIIKPFIPQTSDKISASINKEKITFSDSLFPRL